MISSLPQYACLVYASRRNTCAQTWAAWDSPHEMQRPILYESKAFKQEDLLLERFLNEGSLWIVLRQGAVRSADHFSGLFIILKASSTDI